MSLVPTEVESTAEDEEKQPAPPAPAPPRRRWRDWLIPRSVLGITSILLAFSVGASLSGVALYSYYEYRLTNTERRVDDYIKGFDNRFNTASETLDAETQKAQASIQKELEPLRQFQAEGGTVAALVQKVGKSVWFVETMDENGSPSVGSAFVVESNERESVLVGSWNTIKAATRSPGPAIYMSDGTDKVRVQLDNWVEDRDLAVFTMPRGNLPKLSFVPQDRQPRIGQRVFIASGLGAAGAAMTQGFISDVNQTALQQDAAVGPSYQGGPVLNSDGEVVAVASTVYAPFNFAPGAVTFSVPIRLSCEKLLRCP